MVGESQILLLVCSGDIFHPDFQPAYFDVSIHSTARPAFISSSAYCAGVTAAAGEGAKFGSCGECGV